MENERLKKILFIRAQSFAETAAYAQKNGSPTAYTLSRIAQELHNLVEDSGLKEEYESYVRDFYGDNGEV